MVSNYKYLNKKIKLIFKFNSKNKNITKIKYIIISVLLKKLNNIFLF
jgi:hypothetical protein